MFCANFVMLVLQNMKVLKKFGAWEKKQMKNPETVLAVWVALGIIIGIGMDNIGVGIAIGLSIGAAMSVSQKKKNQRENDDNSKEVEDII